MFKRSLIITTSLIALYSQSHASFGEEHAVQRVTAAVASDGYGSEEDFRPPKRGWESPEVQKMLSLLQSRQGEFSVEEAKMLDWDTAQALWDRDADSRENLRAAFRKAPVDLDCETEELRRDMGGAIIEFLPEFVTSVIVRGASADRISYVTDFLRRNSHLHHVSLFELRTPNIDYNIQKAARMVRQLTHVQNVSEVLGALKALPLKSLALDYSAFYDPFLEGRTAAKLVPLSHLLQGNKTIESLSIDMGEMEFGYGYVEQLARTPQPHQTDILGAFASATNLRALHIQNALLDDSLFGVMTQAIQRLRELKTFSWGAVESYGFTVSGEEQALSEMNRRQLKVFMGALTRLDSLDSLIIKGVQITQDELSGIVSALRANSRLTELAFERCSVAASDIAGLAEAFRGLGSLQSVVLPEFTQVSDEARSTVVKALPADNLSAFIVQGAVGDETLGAITKGVRQASDLKSLVLDASLSSDSALQEFAQAVSQSFQLRTLDIQGNAFEQRRATRLFHLLGIDPKESWRQYSMFSSSLAAWAQDEEYFPDGSRDRNLQYYRAFYQELDGSVETKEADNWLGQNKWALRMLESIFRADSGFVRGVIDGYLETGFANGEFWRSNTEIMGSLPDISWIKILPRISNLSSIVAGSTEELERLRNAGFDNRFLLEQLLIGAFRLEIGGEKFIPYVKKVLFKKMEAAMEALNLAVLPSQDVPEAFANAVSSHSALRVVSLTNLGFQHHHAISLVRGLLNRQASLSSFTILDELPCEFPHDPQAEVEVCNAFKALIQGVPSLVELELSTPVLRGDQLRELACLMYNTRQTKRVRE